MPTEKSFYISDMLSEGWRITKENLSTVLLLQIAAIIVMGFAGIISGFLSSQNEYYGDILSNILFAFVHIILALAVLHISLKFAKGEKADFNDLYARLDCFFTYLVASLIYGFVVLLGLILLIVPGIIFAVRFSLFGYFIIEKGSGPIRALEESWDTVKGVTWRVFLMSILFWLINLLGLLCLIVGLLFTFPWTTIALALMYRKLSQLTFPRTPTLPTQSTVESKVE